MNTKTKILLSLLLIVPRSPVFAAQTFTGKATLDSSGCRTYPAQKEAETDCLKQSVEFCSTFARKSQQVSAFTYSNSCVRGRGYANGDYSAATLATASFNCVE